MRVLCQSARASLVEATYFAGRPHVEQAGVSTDLFSPAAA